MVILKAPANELFGRGYNPSFDGKNRDGRFTIANQQTYLRRLVLNEPGLQDLNEAYKISTRSWMMLSIKTRVWS